MSAVKSTVVLALAFVLAAALRRRSAACRHLVFAAAIACASLMPWIAAAAPGWQIASTAPPSFEVNAQQARGLVLVWVVGVAIGWARLLAGCGRLAWHAARAVRVEDGDWKTLADRTAGELGLGRSVLLLEGDGFGMPVTWGLLRPRILLPRSARHWTADRLRAVLAHELAHVQRADWFVQIAAEVAAAIHWFNPLMWAARRRLRLESERACDDAVLRLDVSGPAYAADLIAIARAVRGERTASAAAPAVARAPDLERRILSVLAAGLDRDQTGRASAAMITAGIAAFAVLVGGADKPAGAPPLRAAAISDVQRNIMTRFGAVETKFSIPIRDISFRRDRLEGRVELQARLAVDGSAVGVRVVEPAHPDLVRAATSIVRQWRHEPARLHGVPIEVPLRLTVDFTGAQ